MGTSTPQRLESHVCDAAMFILGYYKVKQTSKRMKQKKIIVVFPKNRPILEMKITLCSSFPKVYDRKMKIFCEYFCFAKVYDPKVYILNQP